ncbi:MAG: GIY-YIG nuclease family protein [Bacteroidota bacterium]
MATEVFLPYGLDEKEQIIHISQVKSGTSHLRCPFCLGELIAKKGNILTHHFAHKGQTCKSVEHGELNRIVPGIPFYTDFYVSPLSETEKRALKILFDNFGLNPFHRKGQKNSAFHLLFQNDFMNLNKVWNRLLDTRHIEEWGNWHRFTQQAEIGMGLLSVKEFAELQAQKLKDFEFFLRTGKEPVDLIRLKVFENIKERLLSAKLYCMHIPAKKQEKSAWKVGITTRSAKERMKELKVVISHHFGEERAENCEVVFEKESFGRLEAYIKKRFADSRIAVEYKGHSYTEFFADKNILKELKALKI